jgi:hypothetical protein
VSVTVPYYTITLHHPVRPGLSAIAVALEDLSQFRQEPYQSGIVAPSPLTAARAQFVELSAKSFRRQIQVAIGRAQTNLADIYRQGRNQPVRSAPCLIHALSRWTANVWRLCSIRHSRHTFGSLLIQNVASIVYVKEQMGHSSIQVTVDTYRHLIPGANVTFVDRLDELSGQKPETKPAPIRT